MNERVANLAAIQGRIGAAIVRSGRSAGDVELLVVSKTWPVDMIAEVASAGHCSSGECVWICCRCVMVALFGIASRLCLLAIHRIGLDDFPQ